MKQYKIQLDKVLIVTLVSILVGCSSTNPMAYKTAKDLNSYNTLTVANSIVTSDGKSLDTLADNQKIGSFCTDSISHSLASMNKKVVTQNSGPHNKDHMLNIQCKVDIYYGGLRYLQGFSAGKGYATISLTAADNITGAQIYNDVNTFELSTGVYGFSLQIFKGQISEQVKKFEHQITL